MATTAYFEQQLLSANLDRMLKSGMVHLCRGLRLDHRGLKAALKLRLEVKALELRSAASASSAGSAAASGAPTPPSRCVFVLTKNLLHIYAAIFLPPRPAVVSRQQQLLSR